MSHLIESLTPLGQDFNSTQQTGRLKSCFNVPLLFDFDRKKERQKGWEKRKKGKKRQEIGRGLTVKPLMKQTGLWILLFMSPLLLDLSPYLPRNNGHCHLKRFRHYFFERIMT